MTQETEPKTKEQTPSAQYLRHSDELRKNLEELCGACVPGFEKQLAGKIMENLGRMIQANIDYGPVICEGKISEELQKVMELHLGEIKPLDPPPAPIDLKSFKAEIMKDIAKMIDGKINKALQTKPTGKKK